MESYERFAPFYDAVMGNREQSTKNLIGFVKKYNPKAKTVLELACGTGSVLKYFEKRHKIYGVDLSGQMLAVAKKKIPKAKLSHQNMVSFRLSERFDIIFCVFDSINHVLRFRDWEGLFANASRHLNAGGVFIFDINTEERLKTLISQPAWIHKFGNNYLVMKVNDGGKGVSDWNIKVFQNIRKNQYLLHEEDIKEISFPKDRITKALKKHFHKINVIDTDKDNPRKKGNRFYFVCKN